MSRQTSGKGVKVGIYGGTGAGKTRFLFAVCRAALAVNADGKTALNDTARAVYTEIQQLLSLQEQAGRPQTTETTSGAREGIQVTIPFSSLSSTQSKVEEYCTFTFSDGKGELLTEEVRGWNSGVQAGKQDAVVRAIKKCDGFLFVVNPFKQGSAPNDVKAALLQESIMLQTFLEKMYILRGNRFLPLLIVVSHDDIIQENSEVFQPLIDQWRGEACTIVQKECTRRLKKYHPPQLVSPNYIFHQISLVGENETFKALFKVLEALHNLQSITKKYRSKGKYSGLMILAVIVLLVVLCCWVYRWNSPPPPDPPIINVIASLQEDQLPKGGLREAVDFYAQIPDKDDSGMYLPDKVDLLKAELDKRFRSLHAYLSGDASREEKLERATYDLYAIPFREGKYPEEWRLSEILEMVLDLRIAEFEAEAVGCVVRCRAAQTPPVERLKKLLEIAKRADDSDWIKMLPDSGGKKVQFQKELGKLMDFLDARILQNGYDVEIKVGGVLEQEMSNILLYLLSHGTETQISIRSHGNRFSTKKARYKIKCSLEDNGDVFKLVYLRKEDDEVTIRTLGGTSVLREFGMPLVYTVDQEFESSYKDYIKMEDGTTITITIMKTDIPQLLLDFLTKAGDIE